MQADADFVGLLDRFEPVEQAYDGLGGKLIPWSKEYGNTSDDPSVQVFVLDAAGEVVGRSADGITYQSKALCEWLREKAAEYERAHPPTAVPLVRAEVLVAADGTVRCPALDEARKAGRPALLYFGRGSAPEGDRKLAKEVEAARKFEKGTLDSKPAAKSAEGWVLLRFDLAEEAHAKLAAALGVTEAPRVLLAVAGEEAPLDLGAPSAGKLQYQLKKRAPEGD